MKQLHLLLFILLSVVVNAQTTVETDPIPNEYASVTVIDYCTNSVDVTAGSEGVFAPGDKVLIIQMKGAELDNSNSDNNGNPENYLSAGNYEINEVRFIGFSGALTIQFEYNIAREYDVSGSVQLVKIPQYADVDFQVAELTALPWNGSIGGVLIIEASGNINLNSNINLSGRGFRGAEFFVVRNECYNNVTGEEFDGYTCSTSDRCGAKIGEGIGGRYNSNLAGRGKNGNGGGGGANDNGGGAGGSNLGAGGKGGANDNVNTGFCEGSGGLGGSVLEYNSTANKLFLGGGGGAAHHGNASSTNGQNGGGLVFLIAESFTGNGNSINANGNDVTDVALGDGAGGGGAGGTVILDINQFNGNLIVDVSGGNGGDISDNINCPGLGGGGGGGAIWTTGNTASGNIAENISGGNAGTHLSGVCAGVTFGVENGENGSLITGFDKIIADIPFQQMRILTAETDTTICLGDETPLTATITTASHDYNFNWEFDNNSISTDLNTTVSPTNRGVNTYTAISRATIFGQECEFEKDVFIGVRNPDIFISASPDTAINAGEVVFLSAVIQPTNPDYTYSWSPNLVTPQNERNTLAEPFETTDFCLTVTDEIGCEKTACIEVEVKLPFVGVPDAFSPNGDAYNEIFTPILDPVLDITNLRIYNRWGEIIYNSSSVFEWDGKIEGKLALPELYLWVIDVKHKNTGETGTQIGNVTLIR